MKSRLFLVHADLNSTDKAQNFFYGISKIQDISTFMVKWVKRSENTELIYEVYVIIVFFYYLGHLTLVLRKSWTFWESSHFFLHANNNQIWCVASEGEEEGRLCVKYDFSCPHGQRYWS